ncbi:hypothetical protein [Niabella beijingensis]|uniref:hypothetical protein n=1 Tax=Niabella beijingensis TaxID=2872700 RepID=UPI001CBE42A9|nr:hypothetical protein [Niabella beijingensis]
MFRIFYKSFVKPFYRENAATFVFVFTLFFFIIGTVDGAGLFRYHYGLIKALLSIKPFFAAALVLWTLYARKCAVFISQHLQQPAYQFMTIFKNRSWYSRYSLFFFTNFILLLPMTFYILLVITEGVFLHLYPATFIVILFITALCLLLPAWHVWLLEHPERKVFLLHTRLTDKLPGTAFRYAAILIRSVFKTQKLAWTGVKLYTCTFLYFVLKNNETGQDDLRFTFLLFSFGVLANGVFINRLRRYEDQYLSFYRGLPVRLTERFLVYAGCCMVLLMPDLVLLQLLSPVFISHSNAVAFGLYAVSAPLLLVSISFIKQMALRHFIKILLLLFFAGYALMMTAGMLSVSLLFILLAIPLFAAAYYRSEPSAS